jgi:hypothetical protein
MNRVIVLLKSKTLWGAVLTAAAWLLNQPHVGPLEILQALGAIVSAAGVRDAITKAEAFK